MKKQPKRVEIRSYQVGFGDCFLISFVYGTTDKRHVLIDFGTTGLPKNGKPSVHMKRIAEQIKADCAPTGRLTAIVATHRHADHISGFGTDGKTGQSGLVIKDLRPKRVLQPWTEDPNARPTARQATTNGSNKGFVAALATMNDLAARVERLVSAKPAWMSATVRRELQFLGGDNIANKSAIENLIAMGEAKGAKSLYLRYGAKSGLEALLPGVKVRVLGPPDLTQTNAIRKQRQKDPQEFWQLVSGMVPLKAGAAARHLGGASSRAGVPVEGRWFRDRLVSQAGRGLLEIVRQLDQQMNNTSLILLFEVFGKKLLFPGDAQLENWSYALAESKNSKENAKLLAGVDFYKVGHHGSLNATPKKLLWENFAKRKGKVLRTMVSTMPGKHGSKTSKTEVPRATLLAALKDGSRLKSTVDLGATDLFNLETIVP